MNGWMWCVIGLSFMVVELLFPSGFYLFLFGVSGLLVGLLTLLGLVTALEFQLAAFAVLAIFLCIVCATYLKSVFRPRGGVSNDALGKTVQVGGVLPPGATGNGELWGSPWKIKNVGEGELAAGGEAVVVAVDGLTLQVKARQ